MMVNRLVIFILVGLLSFAQFGPTVSALCPEFASGTQVGILPDEQMDEISGIAASRDHPGVIWSHNDAGDSARLWAMNTLGNYVGTYNLIGTTARDWEDVAIGPGPDATQDYLYIADTGNNDGLTDFAFTIYRVAEPNVNANQDPVTMDLTGADSLLVRYPDSLAHGCETILVDPLNGNIYLCTRDRWGDDNGVMKVYCYPAPHTPDVEYTMQHVADVQLLNGEMAVGGDVSLDGKLIVIRTKGDAMRVVAWQRESGTDLWESFDNPMCVLPQVDEPQGEAICFEANGCGYYTTSEGLNQPIYYFARIGICPESILTGDLNWDGYVDLTDLYTLSSNWLDESFTAQNFMILDDFESYNDTPGLDVEWYDQAGAPDQTLETQEVYKGSKAMRIDYSGSIQSTVRKDIGASQDWTIYENIKIYFKGLAANKAKDITLSLFNSTGTLAASATFDGGTKIKNWTTLELDLDPANPLLQTIQYINLTINAEGTSGTVYFDNLEGVSTEPVYACTTTIYEDLNSDCCINMLDFAKLALHWLTEVTP